MRAYPTQTCACCPEPVSEQDLPYGFGGDRICPRCAAHKLRALPDLLQALDTVSRNVWAIDTPRARQAIDNGPTP